MRWEERKIASRYANSLFMLSREQSVLEEIHQNMLLLAHACNESCDLRNMLESPFIKHDKKRIILERIFHLKLHKLTFAIIALVTYKRRESLIPAIASEFHMLYNTFHRIQKASIITPVPLDNDLRNTVKEIVQKYSGKEVVELDEQIEEDLIGGFVLRIDDRQIDASLRSSLKALKMTFMRNV